MIISFLELWKTPDADPQDVIDTLKDYSETGAGISSQVVIEILKRTTFSGSKVRELLAAAQAGVETHMGKSGRVGFRHVPPEVSAAAKQRGAWLEVLQYGEDARLAKSDAEMQEAGEYQTVVNYVRTLLRETE